MTNSRIPTGRASTPEAKRAALERLLSAGERVPQQRLGELLINACNDQAVAGAVGLFGIEDEPLIGMVERFAAPGEIPPMATNYSAAPVVEKPFSLADIEAATLAVKPDRGAIAAIERGAFIAIAQAAARKGITWDDAAAKVIADAEPEKRLLAKEVIDAARRRGELEPGLALLVRPSTTAISSPRTAEAAVWATAETCGCHACTPPAEARQRMILCPKCGNKRCPMANHHNNACTNSNEPGQPGSAYV